MVENFYESLFTSEPCEATDEVLESIRGRVTDDMNADLCKEYTDEEIKTALFQMGPTKAPGPDGFPALFYQTHWDFFHEDICRAVRTFLDGGQLPEGFCDSFVVLIPKITNPQHLKNFRPISLCNVIYKVISKVLSLRLKGIIHEVISPMQSAFVPGRLITNNVLVAYESIHAIKNKRNGVVGSCVIKLDMHKAYDIVEWIFLENMMRKLVFYEV
jgi:hypothetical protein